LWGEMDGLRHSPGYAELLGAQTWRERLVELRDQLAASAWRFALPALPGAAAVALAFYLLVPQPTHYTAGAQPQRITLSDRSSVILKPASSFDFEIAHGQRLATLVGEAQFAIAHDAAHPFLVNIGDAQVRVVGTRFTLAYRDGCTQLSVLSGTVDIGSRSMKPRRLHAGEETVAIDNDRSYRMCLDRSAAGEPLRWSYVDVPLSTVVDDLARVYPKKIVIQSPELASERVTMTFRIEEVENVINLIPAIVAAKIEYGKDGTVHIVRG